jgi:LCP family protein required for cell wall assembly
LRKQKKIKKPLTLKEKIIATISVVLMVASVGAIVSVVLLNWRPLQKDGLVDQTIITPLEIQDKSMNILIVGIDNEPGRNKGKQTDIIMVANFDLEANKINILQFPRDTYVSKTTITGKINATYSLKKNGGMDGLAKLINNQFKLPIDHYAMIEMDGFRRVIDSIGGVQMDVPISFNLDGITIKKGLQTLNGIKAEKVVRERHSYPGQDLGRIETQRIFLAALFNKVKETKKTELANLIPKVSKDISTDFKVGEILTLLEKIQGVKSEDISAFLVPGQTATNTNKGGYKNQSVYSIHLQQTANLLNEHFRAHSDLVFAEDLNCIELKNTSTSNDVNGTDFGKLLDEDVTLENNNNSQ